MGYVANKGVHRIELSDFDGSANWVEIHAARSYGAALRQKTAGLKANFSEKAADSTVDFDFAASRLALFKESIVGWSLKGEETDAEALPLTDETFLALDEGVGDWLAEQIQGWYKARTVSEPDRKNSNGRLTAP